MVRDYSKESNSEKRPGKSQLSDNIKIHTQVEEIKKVENCLQTI